MKLWFSEYVRDNITLNYKRYMDYCVEGKTETECFEKIYAQYVRPLRYCNGRIIILADTDVNRRFNDWKMHGVSVSMYYGNGAVD